MRGAGKDREGDGSPGTLGEVDRGPRYSVESALFQWEEGERRVRDTPAPDRFALERAVGKVLDELRRRLGGPFTVEELTALYAEGTDRALELAAKEGAGVDAAWVVDAAFNRYARGAANFAAGRRGGESGPG